MDERIFTRLTMDENRQEEQSWNEPEYVQDVGHGR